MRRNEISVFLKFFITSILFIDNVINLDYQLKTMYSIGDIIFQVGNSKGDYLIYKG